MYDAGLRKGTHDLKTGFLISVVLGLLIGVILFYVYGSVIGGKITEFTNILFNVADENLYEKDCVLLGKESFKKGEVYDFVDVEFGGVELKDVEHLGLLMECGYGVFKGADIEGWMVSAHDNGAELFDSPIEVGVVCGELKSASIQFIESNGYETEVPGNSVDVHIEIKDKLFAGTSADMYLCYSAHR